MTGSLNALHPAPNSETVAAMEMQPDVYDVLSLGSHYPRDDADDAPHARAHVVFAFGKGCTKAELHALLFDALADLHALLETKHTLRLEYVPGDGDGPVPPDAALNTTDGENPHV